MEEVLFDSRDRGYKDPFGCIEKDRNLYLCIKIKESLKPKDVSVVFLKDDLSGLKIFLEKPMYPATMFAGYMIFSADFIMDTEGLFFYYFKFRESNGDAGAKETIENKCIVIRKKGNVPGMMRGNINTVSSDISSSTINNVVNAADCRYWQISCYKNGFETPETFKGKIMYQIFPDRFYQKGECDLTSKLMPYWIHENKKDTPWYLPDEHGEVLNNDFFEGNLQGIKVKISHLVSLNVDVVYLNPIFFAYSNHRYDTADYKKIDPMLGTEKDFIEFVDALHHNGIKLILDGVFSHVGSNSIYFDKNHIWGTGALSDPDSKYRDWFHFDHYPDQYTAWWGIKTLPAVNELDPAFLNYILYDDDSVVKHWLNLGADGFRLDVADELPDEFIKRMRDVLKVVNPEAILIGEVWEDASNKVSYSVRREYFLGSELDSVMNYVYKDAILGFVKGETDACTCNEAVMGIAENYPKQVLHSLMNILSTHDTPRLLTSLNEGGFGKAGRIKRPETKEERGEARIKGEDIDNALRLQKLAVVLQYCLPGMPCIYYGDEIGMQGYEDPFNRRYFDWNSLNDVTVREILEFYKALGRIKMKYAALRTGDILPYYANGGGYAFIRASSEEKILCVVNASDSSHEVNYSDIVDEVYSAGCFVADDKIICGPYGFGVYSVQ